MNKKWMILALMVLVGSLASRVATMPTPVPAKGVHPVYAEGVFLGGSMDGKWTEAKDMVPRLKGGEKYRFYSLAKFVKSAVGGKPHEGELCEWEIDFKPELSVGDLVGLVGDWDPLPRAPRSESVKQKVYEDAAREILKPNKITGVKIGITRVLRVDLEGDGQDEVIFSARTPDPNYVSAERGVKKNDFSFVALRKIVNGQVKTFFLAGEFFPEVGEEGELANEFAILAVLDLNGDGVEEVLLTSEYYEGASVLVFSVVGPEPALVLADGCGA